jgi:nickel transport protein
MNVRPLILLGLVSVLLALTAAAVPAQSVQALEQTPPAAAPLPAEIEKAFEKALDKKLAPVMRTLAEMREEKVRLTDVLGGLGYIFGLVGAAAYFKRKPG